jgi:hypothetical protein
MINYEPHLTHFFVSKKKLKMNEGNDHTSKNEANILIKLGVHPNIISKSTKNMDQKGLFKVITWLGYERNVICGKVEFKKFDIEDIPCNNNLLFLIIQTLNN